MIDDIETEIQLLDNHNFVKAAKLMAQIKEELKNGVQTCAAGVKHDVEEVLKWAEIFDNEKELECTVLKHLLLHCIEMARFILREKSDRAAGKFFNAGKDAADALVLAVGPVKKFGFAHAEAAPIGDKEVADFAAGILYGLTGDNQTT